MGLMVHQHDIPAPWLGSPLAFRYHPGRLRLFFPTGISSCLLSPFSGRDPLVPGFWAAFWLSSGFWFWTRDLVMVNSALVLSTLQVAEFVTALL
ncbi:hypothetical protein CYMTET_45827 [Cymbomonas tetramitiformis]|uniref:Uncharacterized protein n=1 Tax=Cymbomonas tetramitiformis TaxID=36881 RepID=A0AAE0BXE4_9CHLO|nr:hypothetical protein CYMTET_45827 [Cymbomonas tetramitiformis]